ncbi:MAG: hypothetical protein OCC49_18705 [Fibrobacterales bacterium]
MPTFSSSIYIDAPLHAVWSILINTIAYKDWNKLFSTQHAHLLENNTELTLDIPLSSIVNPIAASVTVFEKWKALSFSTNEPNAPIYTLEATLQKVNDNQMRFALAIDLQSTTASTLSDSDKETYQETLRATLLTLQDRAELFVGCVGS